MHFFKAIIVYLVSVDGYECSDGVVEAFLAIKTYFNMTRPLIYQLVIMTVLGFFSHLQKIQNAKKDESTEYLSSLNDDED